MNHYRIHRSLLLAGILTLAAALLLAPAPTGAQEGAFPAESPDALAGLITFNERCSNCHGPQALGDGELAASLPNPPAPLASAEYMRSAVPASMFDTVTNGRIDNGMPPFGPTSTNPLEESQRWQAIAAVFSLGTPVDSVEEGQGIYEANCLACHGGEGLGDGPDAADFDPPPGDLTDLSYWSNISNQAVFDRLQAAGIEGHDYELDEDSLWAVVDYLRTFSYEYTDALAAFRPLESATVSGMVTNGTSDEVVDSEPTALLRAFTQELEITLSMSTTVGADGIYLFELSDVPQDWFYRVGLTYEGVEFGSDFGELSFQEPDLVMPITVFENTSDPQGINIQQLHMILSFAADDLLQVSELYVASNNDSAVFIGEGGNMNLGTFEILVPEAAENISFQRGFGSLDSFFPAAEVIQTENGWADTLPVRPGPSSLTLLASYTLPYDSDGIEFAHDIPYQAQDVQVIVAQGGVELDSTGGWVSEGQTTMPGGTISTYSRSGLAAGETVTVSLSGEPEISAETAGAVSSSNELLIGGAAILLAAVAGIFLARRWQQGAPASDLDREELLQMLADLDDDYADGLVDEDEYEEERQLLKDELLAIWEAEQEYED